MDSGNSFKNTAPLQSSTRSKCDEEEYRCAHRPDPPTDHEDNGDRDETSTACAGAPPSSDLLLVKILQRLESLEHEVQKLRQEISSVQQTTTNVGSQSATDKLPKSDSVMLPIIDDLADPEKLEGPLHGLNSSHHLGPPTAKPAYVDNSWRQRAVELLQAAFRQEMARSGNPSPLVRKAQIRSILRETSPGRFPNSKAVHVFLWKTIQQGLLIQTGISDARKVRLAATEPADQGFPPCAPSARSGPLIVRPANADRQRKDDALEVLRAVFEQVTGTMGDSSPNVLKSRIGLQLRTTYAVQFPNREAVRKFFVEAIAMGLLIETGKGEYKKVRLASNHTDQGRLCSSNSVGSSVWESASLDDPIPTSFKEILCGGR